MDGEQYVGVASGYGGAVPLWGTDLSNMDLRGAKVRNAELQGMQGEQRQHQQKNFAKGRH